MKRLAALLIDLSDGQLGPLLVRAGAKRTASSLTLVTADGTVLDAVSVDLADLPAFGALSGLVIVCTLAVDAALTEALGLVPRFAKPIVVMLGRPGDSARPVNGSADGPALDAELVQLDATRSGRPGRLIGALQRAASRSRSPLSGHPADLITLTPPTLSSDRSIMSVLLLTGSVRAGDELNAPGLSENLLVVSVHASGSRVEEASGGVCILELAGSAALPRLARLRAPGWAEADALLLGLENKPEVSHTAANLLRAIAAAETGIPTRASELFAGLTPEQIERELASAQATGLLVRLRNRMLFAPHYALWTRRASYLLMRYHERFPNRSGPTREELRAGLRLEPVAFGALLARWMQVGTFQETDGRIRLTNFTPKLNSRQVELLLRIEEVYRSAGIAAPPIAAASREVGAPPDAVRALLPIAVAAGSLRLVTGDRYCHRDAEAEFRAEVAARIQQHGEAAPAELRDHFGVSRQCVVDMLEMLDREGFTTRREERRVLAETPRESPTPDESS